MNKTRKFMTFLENMVQDTELLTHIKSGYKVCLESEVTQDGDNWIVEIDELAYPVEIATKYFDLPKAIHEYKRESGVDNIDKDDIVVRAMVTVDFEYESTPHLSATSTSPAEEGGVHISAENIVDLSLHLEIDGSERDAIEIDDQAVLKELDNMVLAAIEKGIAPHLDQITEQYENDEYESYNDSRAEMTHDQDMY